MTHSTEATAVGERRAQSHQAIDRLVSHRTQMLALYSELAVHRPFEKSSTVVELLKRFCQSLVDYSADAHFRLYRYVDNDQERRMSVSKVAKEVYPYIERSTQKILDFNDRYDSDEHCEDSVGKLENDLSVLGEILADRIELEDRLIDVLGKTRS